MNENTKKDVVINVSKFEFISNELRRIDNPEIKKGYLKFACGSAEDKTALLAAYSARYPEDAENLEFIAREIEADVKAKDEEKKDKTYAFDPLNIFKYLKELAEDLAVLYGRAFKLAVENLEYFAPKRKAETLEDMPEEYKDFLLTAKERQKEDYIVVDKAKTEEKVRAEKISKGLISTKNEKPSLLSRIKGLFARNHKPKVEKISLEEINGSLPEDAKPKTEENEAKKRAAYEASLARRREKAATYSPAEKSA